MYLGNELGVAVSINRQLKYLCGTNPFNIGEVKILYIDKTTHGARALRVITTPRNDYLADMHWRDKLDYQQDFRVAIAKYGGLLKPPRPWLKDSQNIVAIGNIESYGELGHYLRVQVPLVVWIFWVVRVRGPDHSASVGRHR